jgi:hypothetical protein
VRLAGNDRFETAGVVMNHAATGAVYGGSTIA